MMNLVNASESLCSTYNGDDLLKIIVPFGINVESILNPVLDKEWMRAMGSEQEIEYFSLDERVKYIERKLNTQLSNEEREKLQINESRQLAIYSDIIQYNLSNFYITWLKNRTRKFSKNTLAIVNKNENIFFIVPDTVVTIKGGFYLSHKKNKKNNQLTQLNTFDYSGIFNVLSTLSFALPQPWGVVTAAGVQLLELIIGSLSNLTGLTSIVTLLRKQLELEFKQHDITTYAAELSNYMAQLQTYVTTANNLPNDFAYIENEVLVFLKSQKVTTSGSIYDSLNQIIVKSYYLGENKDDKLSNYAIGLIIQLLTILIVNQRSIIIFTAQLASLQYGKDLDKYNYFLDLWLGEYNELRNIITSLISLINIINNNFIKHRDSLMSIKYYPLPHRHGVTDNAICTITDSWTGYTCTSSLGASQSIDEFKSERQSFFLNYKSEQMKSFSEWVSYIFPENEIKNKLVYAAKTWNEKTTPMTPENNISVKFDHESDLARWSESSVVYYAVEFKNYLGSKISEYKPFTTTKGMYPSLDNIPTDNLYLTRTRVLHCKQNNNDRVVAIFKDNTTTTFEDKNS